MSFTGRTPAFLRRRGLAAVALAAGLALGAAACGEDGDSGQAGDAGTPTTGGMSQSAQPASGPFGPACAAVPTSGEGSVQGMVDDPVATAASNNPALSTLVTAVKKADLVKTLNGTDGITVFAPTNEAFAKIPKGTLDQVLADRKKLTEILTYHVVKGRKTPADLGSGSFTTLQGGTLTTSGSGTSYRIGDANVTCGDVQTANATVYIIDTVLMPKA